MAGTTRAMVATNIWTARLVPVMMFGLMGYATYVIVAPLSIDYLIRKHNDTGTAIAILVSYFFVLFVMLVAFLRLLHITYFDPSYVPLGPAAVHNLDRDEKRHMTSSEKRDAYSSGSKTSRSRGRKQMRSLEKKDEVGRSGEYQSGGDENEPPGMEMFYTKDVFVAEMDGKPKWCTHCANWKPDRAHHCSASGRCIKKMDHFCPWVGGPVGENNFKFFIQFTAYCALYCLHILVTMAFFVNKLRTSPTESLNAHFAVALGLSALFGLFTAGMTATSVELAIRNQTQVERLGAETRIHIMAVIKPPSFSIPPIVHREGPILSYPELTYPLDSGPTTQVTHSSGDPQNKLPLGEDQRSNLMSGTDNDSLQPIQASDHHDHDLSDSQSRSRDLSSGSTVVGTTGDTSRPASKITEPTARWPNAQIAQRDLAAKRTFLILKMPGPGFNPWDLGSSLLNWESIMGESVLDWFLPFKRSPCCSHEQDESYYEVGPMVDILKSKYGLIPESEIRAFGGRRRAERLDPADYPSANLPHTQEDTGEGFNQWNRNRKQSNGQNQSAADQPSIELGQVGRPS